MLSEEGKPLLARLKRREGGIQKMSEVPMNKECGAKATTDGHQLCRRTAMANGRCYLHGGKSTGAKTEEGRYRQKMASWKHGMRSKEVVEENKCLNQKLKIFHKNLFL